MIRSAVNKYLRAALNELFIDAGDESVQLSMGLDLFTDSNIQLKNLTFKPDLFDALFQPLQLISGHLGKLNIDGIAELALTGGTVRCQAENIYLLFAVDTNSDAEQVQFLKKLLVELQTGDLQHFLVRELLKKIQGFPIGKDPNVKKKRLLLLKIMNYLFKNIQFQVKTVHIRIEAPCRGLRESSLYCSSIGITLPLLRVTPNSGTRPDGVGKDDPILSLLMKNLQVYCDYDCESYTANGSEPAHVLSQFVDRWKCEVHTALLLPFDAEIVVAAEVRRRSGLLSPKFHIVIPKLQVACDPRQLEVLKDFVELVVTTNKRYST